jgi:acetoin utilization protein AcuB
MKVKHVMTRNPITIDPDAPLATAMAVMKKKRVRHLPVVDDSGRLVGIITDRDLRSAALAPAVVEHLSVRDRRRARSVGQALEELHVRDAMTWGVVTTHPEASLPHAARALFYGRLGSLPVLQNAKLVGILTERDVLEVLATRAPEQSVAIKGFLW